ncbi:DUF6314 family protein [Gryllotalpicola reticulitermitis]|uniref:DUF6314 family protein n=1 Tax=Gryllotalpicola reticulitermitis TaxID=1184153 RepID=A0ABV8Q4B3_9MICO
MEPGALIGTWRFERAIRDRASATDYRARGEAEFTPLADGRIRWAEHGVLEWADGTTPVERTLYLVRADHDRNPSDGMDDPWTVTFDDGSDFHPWAAGPISHWCSPDSYDGRLAGADGPSDAWSLTWTVVGPHKSYTMTTKYRRRA